MDITVGRAQLTAQDIDIDGTLTLQEARLNATGIAAGSGPSGATVRVTTLSITLVLTEVALNRFLAGREEDPVRDLEVALLNGRVRIQGRYNAAGPLWIPFSAVGAPEIEGGARLRFNWQQINPVGIPFPKAAVQFIGEIINNRINQGFDLTKLPLPARLTDLTVETGRLLLSATAAIEFRPSETAVEKAGSNLPDTRAGE